FAGGYLAEELAKDPALSLYGVTRRAQPLRPPLHERVTCLHGDLRSAAFVREVLAQVRPDVIYHLAGQAFVPEAWSKPWETVEANVRPQLNLFQAMIDLGLAARFLSVTSSKVYGHAPAERMPLREDAPFSPDNPYGVSKATQDLLARQYYLSHRLPVIVARPFNHIGPRQKETFVTASFARQIALAEAGVRSPVVRVGNLSAARDFTDVRDVVRAYILLVEKGRPGEAYNVGSGRAVVVQAILEQLVSMSRVPIRVEQDPARMRPIDQPLSYGDTTKIRAETGWQPAIPLEVSLRDILDYWRAEVKKENKEPSNL
ncbi:MAG: SDR family oxidoreductase, partial [Caldilineae bacterium]